MRCNAGSRRPFLSWRTASTMHCNWLATSVAAGAAKLLHLTADQTANAIAIAIATADNVSLAAIHSEPVSNWKAISPGITAQRAVYATALTHRGITGPRGIFDGPNGLEELFGQSIDFRLDDTTLGAVKDTYLKKYCALIHGQGGLSSFKPNAFCDRMPKSCLPVSMSVPARR